MELKETPPKFIKMSNNLKVRGLVLRAGEKNLRDNVPIRFNDWATTGGSKKDSETYAKANIIKFSVPTHNHGVGIKGQFETCKEKFLIAKQHRTADEAKTVKIKTPSRVEEEEMCQGPAPFSSAHGCL